MRGKSFGTRVSLSVHVRTVHAKARDFVCGWRDGCVRTSVTSLQLTLHECHPQAWSRERVPPWMVQASPKDTAEAGSRKIEFMSGYHPPHSLLHRQPERCFSEDLKKQHQAFCPVSVP